MPHMSGGLSWVTSRGFAAFVLRMLKDVYWVVGAIAVTEFLTGLDVLYSWMRVFVFVGTLLMSGSWIAKLALTNALSSSFARQSVAKTEKRTRMGHGGPNNLFYVASEMQGWREQMEDTSLTILGLENPLTNSSLFGIFDGHGGPMVAKICEQSFPLEISHQAKKTSDLGTVLINSYRELDSFLQSTGSMKNMRMGNTGSTSNSSSSVNGNTQQSFTSDSPSSSISSLPLFAKNPDSITESIVRENLFDFIGSTAVIAIIRDKEIVVSNAGDSRAILCRNGSAIDLSRDHKPESPRERSRIENAGGRVSMVGPCHRVDFGLNLSRALGDFLYKRNSDLPANEQKITAEPDIIKETLTNEDEFIVMGCDGLFELLTNQQVVNFIRFRLKAGIPPNEIVESLLDECCSKDPQKTLGKGTDNESCILIILPNSQQTSSTFSS